MDTLRVDLEPRHDPGDWTAVRLQVNGRDLTDLISAVEQDRAYEPLVPYDWIGTEGLHPAQTRLAGDAANDWPGGGETLLLVCGECGEEGCWPIVARIEVGERTVVWRNFSNPQWPLRNFGHLRFTFDREEYMAELARAFG